MDSSKKTTMIFIILIFVTVILGIFPFAISCDNQKNENQCSYGDCNRTKISGSNYCYDHRCPADGCTSSKSATSEFCYRHTEDTGTIPTKTAIIVKPLNVDDKGNVYMFNVWFKDTARINTIFYGILTIFNNENEKIYIASTGIMDCGANRIKLSHLSVNKSDIMDYDHFEWQALTSEPSKLGKQQ